MKSITIHKLDEALARVLEERARREGVSINRLVKRLLRSALGLEKEPEPDHRGDFLDLFGTWSDRETTEFLKRIEELETIEPQDWEG
jgi:plasmid stability protein